MEKMRKKLKNLKQKMKKSGNEIHEFRKEDEIDKEKEKE